MAVPPTINQDVDDQSVMFGEHWELDILIVGDDPLEVKVEKDNMQLQESEHMKISSRNGRVTMTIFDVKEQDAGAYKLDVSNTNGAVTCTFNMTVYKYNFRYQYLLVNLGTDVIMKLFNHQVGHDFSSYLASNNVQQQALQSLISPRKGLKATLTSAQAILLPPHNNDSSKLDITLLSCLLRNVCGLKIPSDVVWKTPVAPTDFSVEADITRLRLCRNNLAHNGSVIFPATEFKAKWKELRDILLRLNTFCGSGCIKGLPKLIGEVKEIDIDDGLTQHLIKVIQQWHDNEQDLKNTLAGVETVATATMNIATTVMKDQQGIKRQLTEIMQDNKRPHLDMEYDIQEKLIDVYQSSCFRLPMSPLFKDENQELLKIYKIPSLSVVDYHKAKADHKSTEVESCKDIFYQDQQHCRNIYITGDAGVGKSSMCMYFSLLWSMSHMGKEMTNKRMQEDANFLKKFDYLFYVRLRDTARIDLTAMIVDQLFYTDSEEKSNKMYENVENVLKYHESLVILDGLDEWSPTRKPSDKQDYKIPHRPTLKKCTFLTSCRPYKIENLRLVKEDLDRQVKMTGLHGNSMKSYIADIVKYINEKYDENKNVDDFFRETEQCGLHELLCFPIITSNLLMVWLDQPLTAMSRSLTYGNTIEMLFKIANDRKVEFPPSPSSREVQLPESLSDLVHFREHFSLIDKLSLLSFRSLFKLDDGVTNLVFTTEQLMLKPYFLSSNEQNVLCKLGILSKNKVTRRFGKQEHKLSFLHQSYLEFFAAIFVSFFEEIKLLDTFKNLTTISDVLQFRNLFLFFAGFSHWKLQRLLEQIYESISDELTSCRTNAIFHYKSHIYQKQIPSLQKTIIDCLQEGRKCSRVDVNLKHEDFVFDDSVDVAHLKVLLSLNRLSVKSIHATNGKYLEEFNNIKTLQCLQVGDRFANIGYDEKFTELMVNNESTLCTICIEAKTLIPGIPVSKLHHLTSLCLSYVKMDHSNLQNLLKFLSDNVHIEHITVYKVSCDNHQGDGSNCTFTLNLSKLANLKSLNLWDVNISCHNVNNASLKSITLWPLSEVIASSYIGAVQCVKDSRLEHLYINGDFKLDDNTMKILATEVKTFSCLKYLRLWYMQLPDDVRVQLHPLVVQVEIELLRVTMSRPCFQCFIESCANKKSVIKVELVDCNITSVDAGVVRELSPKESVDYMSAYIASSSAINITYKDEYILNFETTGC